MNLRGLRAGVLLFGLGLVGVGLAGPGCTASLTASGTLTAPAGCSTDGTVSCSGGATGFSCAVGDNPEAEDTSLSCSTPTTSGGQDLYCCYQGFTGSTTTCYPDDSLTAACPDPTSYGYVCAAGDDPTTYDGSLNCSTPTPDGPNDDFCCTYGGGGGGSSSGVVVPTGCTLDNTLGCVGGADGYACAIGSNPETEDPSLSCSTPALASGEDDYCCYSGFTGSSTTCYADDSLTSACPDPTSYGYVCAAGDDPTSYDATLVCSTPVPDPDGVHDDFCCTY